MFAGSADTLSGEELLLLRKKLAAIMGEAASEVSIESMLPTDGETELLVADRKSWISGNCRTLGNVFGSANLPLSPAQEKIVSWEGGALLGLMSRVVLAQYDPFRDALIVVYPNLGIVNEGDGLRWLMFHEVTHLAQFRQARWISEYIANVGRDLIVSPDRDWLKQVPKQLISKLPEIVTWLKASIDGKGSAATPLLDLLPEEQRAKIQHLNSLLTVLEGHATHVTDLISARLIPDYDNMQRRIKSSRKRPAFMKVIEALAGLEMKRQQYIVGREFCEEIWNQAGPKALDPFWAGPDAIPTQSELTDPELWLRRVA